MNPDRQPRGTAFALRDPLPWEAFERVVRSGERLGYRAVFLPEISGRDAFAALMGLAGRTDALLLGTGIVPMTSRPARLSAMGAVTVQERSSGRMILGLGTGTAGRGALDALSERIREIRGLLDGQPGLALRVVPPVPSISRRPRSQGGRTPPAAWPMGSCSTGARRSGSPRHAPPCGMPPRRQGAIRTPSRSRSTSGAAVGVDPTPRWRRYDRRSGSTPRTPRTHGNSSGWAWATRPPPPRLLIVLGDPTVPEAFVRRSAVLGDPTAARERLRAYREAGGLCRSCIPLSCRGTGGRTR